jgi:hypothetical protein
MSMIYYTSAALDQMNRTEYIHDYAGRVLEQKEIYVKKEYNAQTGLWTDVPVIVVSHAYKYDALGNVIKELDALGYAARTGSTEYAKIDSGYGTEKTYDAQGNVLTELTPQDFEDGAESTKTFIYNALGNVLCEVNLIGTKTYIYDDYNRKTTMSDEYGYIWKYNYEDVNNIMNVRYIYIYRGHVRFGRNTPVFKREIGVIYTQEEGVFEKLEWLTGNWYFYEGHEVIF